MPSTATSPVAIKLDAELKERIKTLAQSRQRTSHWLMREAISQYVDREEKLEMIRKDALRAWEEFQSNGLHVTAEEANKWLMELAQGQNTDPPKPHR